VAFEYADPGAARLGLAADVAIGVCERAGVLVGTESEGLCCVVAGTMHAVAKAITRREARTWGAM
jgi:hypothetical protein